MTTLPFTIFPIPTTLFDTTPFTATGTTTANSLASRFGTPGAFLNVKDFGAKGDGSTDDTAAINAALTALFTITGADGVGGTIYFPTGNYTCSGSLNFWKAGTSTSFVAVGANSRETWLTYTGAGTFIFANSFYWTMRDLTIINQGSPGSTIGLELGRPGASGNATHTVLIQNVRVSGFHIGIDCGGDNSNGTSSEVTYVGCIIDNCDTGVHFNDFNCVSHNFFGCASGQNTVGFLVDKGNQINFYGGSSSLDGTTFQVFASGAFAVRSWHAETLTTAFLRAVNFGGYTFVLVDNCNVFGDGAATEIMHIRNNTSVTIRNSFIGGQITAGVVPAGGLMDVQMEQCGVFDTTPFEPQVGATGPNTYRIEGCYQTTSATDPAPAAVFPDQQGFINSATLFPSFLSYHHASGLAVTTVGGLPAAATSLGARATVTDATVVASGNFAAIVAGTGGNTVPVWCDGTNWLIG